MPRKVNQYFHTLIGYHTSREVKNHWHTLALFSRQLLLIICMCTLWKNLRICCLDLHDSKTKPVSWKQWTYCRCGSLVQQVPMYLIVEMQWPRFEADLQPFAVCPPLLILPFSVCFSMQNCQIKAKKPQNKSSFKKRIYSKSKKKKNTDMIIRVCELCIFLCRWQIYLPTHIPTNIRTSLSWHNCKTWLTATGFLPHSV